MGNQGEGTEAEESKKPVLFFIVFLVIGMIVLISLGDYFTEHDIVIIVRSTRDIPLPGGSHLLNITTYVGNKENRPLNLNLTATLISDEGDIIDTHIREVSLEAHQARTINFTLEGRPPFRYDVNLTEVSEIR